MPGTAERAHRVLLGIVGVALLLLVHVTVWRTARNAFVTHVAYPLVASIDTERASQFTLDATNYDRTITAARADRVEVYRAPASLNYLLAALVLVGLCPRRPYWLWLWLAHLAVGAMAFAAFALGVGWVGAGFAANTFLRVYAASVVSLLAVLAVLHPEWSDRMRSVPSKPGSS